MSMMGRFREIPSPLYARLKEDPSLVEEIVGGGSESPPLPTPPPPGCAKGFQSPELRAMQLKIVLSHLSPDERRLMESQPPDKQDEMVLTFLNQLEQVARSMALKKFSAQSRAKTGSVPDRELGEQLDLEKAWHGVHFLLTGKSWKTTPGAGQAVLGGKEVGADRGYGPARLLGPKEVSKVSVALSKIETATLRDRFDGDAMDAAEIYPGGWGEESGNLKWLLVAFKDLQKFYAGAAARGSGVLLYIT